MYAVFLTFEAYSNARPRPGSVSAVTECETEQLPSRNTIRAWMQVSVGFRFLGQLHIPPAYYRSIQLVTTQRAVTLAKG